MTVTGNGYPVPIKFRLPDEGGRLYHLQVKTYRCTQHTARHVDGVGSRWVVLLLQIKAESMEGADMRDLTAMLSSFMDSSGNIDPSKAPPDMAVCQRSNVTDVIRLVLLLSWTAFNQIECCSGPFAAPARLPGAGKVKSSACKITS